MNAWLFAPVVAPFAYYKRENHLVSYFFSAHLFIMNALPFDYSYWVVPGQLLAGCYPGSLKPEVMTAKLTGLLDCGVTLIVNLMHDFETDHSGSPFIEYAQEIEAMAEARGKSLQIMRLPILDMDVPTRAQMRATLDAIHQEINAGGTVFVHCWGGKGRTGTVVGCYLLEEGFFDQTNVLDHIRSLTLHQSDFFWPTPQTDEQRKFVVNWLKINKKRH